MLFAFDDFIFDEARYELRRGGTTLKVEASVLKLLAFFCKHPGDLLSKQELIDEVWEGRALADNVLSVTVAKLRKVLGHTKGAAEYIDNVYGRGYRFTRSVVRDVPSTNDKTARVVPLKSVSRDALLVGRNSVMQRLETGLTEALSGHGRIYLLSGEPGIGKTRICEVFGEDAATSGALVAWGCCHDIEGAPPFWLWYQVLRELEKLGFTEDISDILNRRISDLAAFFQEANLSDEWAVESVTLGHRAVDETFEVIRKMCTRQPLVLLLEDLQWADSASLRFVDYLANETARLPLMAVATLRSTEVSLQNGREEFLRHAVGHRNCERIEIGRLREKDVADYVSALFGEDDADVSHAVYQKSEGIPFYMAELLRPWIGLDRPHPAQLELSGLALDVVRQRIRKLSRETQNVLSAAAVIGREFDLGLLSYITLREVQEILDILEEPLANETIVPSSRDSGSFAFSHELIREVLYGDLAATERRSWHLRAGEGLERRRESAGEIASSELAHHFLSALPDGELLKAIDYTRRAATDAARFFAYSDARVWLRRALGIFQLTVDPDPHAYCRVLLELSFSERMLGDDRHFDHLRQAVAVARKHRFGSVLAAAGRLMNPAPGIDAISDACSVLEAAVEAIPKEDTRLRAIVLAYLAWTPPHSLNARKVEELLATADRLARESNSAEAITMVLRGMLFFSAAPSAQEKARAIADEITRQVASQSEAFRLWHTSGLQVYRIIDAMQRGDSEAVDRVIDDYGAIVQQLNNVELDWHRQRMRVLQRINRGEFVGASEKLKDLKAKAKTQHFQGWSIICALDQNFLRRQTRCRQSITEPFLARARQLLEIKESDCLIIRTIKISNLIDLGLIGEAESALKNFSVQSLRELPVDFNYLGALARLSVASVVTRSLDHAQVLYDLLKPYAYYFAADLTFHCEGSISFFLGMLAQSLGRHTETIVHFEEAIERNLRFGLRAQVARTRYELANALTNCAEQNEKWRVHLLLDQAAETARDLGMEPLQRAVHSIDLGENNR